jgi:hypothetical protein
MKLLLLVLLFPILAFSQEAAIGFNPGYIVKNAGDTLYGLIKNKVAIPYHPLEDIRFKKDERADVEKLSPEEVIEFYIGRSRYVSMYLPQRKRNYFFEQIVKGYLSYFELEVNGYGSHFYAMVLKENDDPIIYVPNNPLFPFRRKVAEYLKDDEELAKKIRTNIYNEAHVLKIVNEYNAFHAKTTQK